jgi:hypothetical protein
VERVTRVGGRCYFDGSLCRSTPCTRVVCMPNIGSHTACSTVAVRSTHRTHTRSHTSKAPLSYVLGLNPVTLVAYMQVISYNMPPHVLFTYTIRSSANTDRCRMPCYEGRDPRTMRTDGQPRSRCGFNRVQIPLVPQLGIAKRKTGSVWAFRQPESTLGFVWVFLL